MNLPDLLAHQARKFPKKEAIVTQSDRISYMEWHITVNKLADSLQKLGIQKGDKVVLHMPNTKEFMYTYFAVQRLGALIVPINAKLVQNEVSYILQHSDAKMFVTHEMLFEGVRNLEKSDNLTLVKTGNAIDHWLSLEDLMAAGNSDEIACDLTEDDEASILYTSGTTGDPKGVVFTYRSILTVAGMICIEMEMKPESRVLHMMPLSHSAPLHLFMGAGIYVGAAHVLTPTFTPDLLLETVEKEKITHFFGAPIAYLASGKHPKIAEFDLSSMEYWVYGGASLSTQEVEFVKKQFSTEKLMCVYGLTEAGPSGSLLAFDEHDAKAGSIGRRGALHCEIRIVDEKGHDVAQGEVGEIILRGEGNMKRYYKDPEKTSETLRGDWLYTGDMAKQDEDGFYWIVDRKKDIIISGGVNIYPKEVEDQLLAHPQITDAAVVGVPNPDWGETVKAFVVTEGELENLTETLQDYLQDKLASYKIPKLYEELEALPRNATGKLLKNQLREQMTS
jgi:acyl-CoA synthetase (AMP-forming)/AMP-acid ligase II